MRFAAHEVMQAMAALDYTLQARAGLKMLNLHGIAKQLDPVIEYLRLITHSQSTETTQFRTEFTDSIELAQYTEMADLSPQPGLPARDHQHEG